MHSAGKSSQFLTSNKAAPWLGCAMIRFICILIKKEKVCFNEYQGRYNNIRYVIWGQGAENLNAIGGSHKCYLKFDILSNLARKNIFVYFSESL